MGYLQQVKIALIYGTFQQWLRACARTVDVYMRLGPEVGYRVIKHVSVMKFRKIIYIASRINLFSKLRRNANTQIQ